MEHNGGVKALPVEEADAGSPAWEKASHEADTQLDLLQVLQDLFRPQQGRLSPSVSPVTKLSEINKEFEKFLNADEHWPIDPDDLHDFTDLQRNKVFRSYLDPFVSFTANRPRSEVRIKALQAIGNCKTLKILDLHKVAKWEMSAADLEALLIPLQTSGQLEEICLYVRCFDLWGLEDRLSRHFEELITNSNGLRILRLYESEYIMPSLLSSSVPWLDDQVLYDSAGNRLAARASALTADLAAAVASALRTKVHHGLEELHFLFRQDTKRMQRDTVKHVAEIIKCAPRLQMLQLHATDHFYLHQDERDALGRALKDVPQLKGLRTWLNKKTIDLLAEVYNGISSSTVLEHLSLQAVHGGARAEALSDLVGGNITSIELLDGGNLSEVFEHGFRPDEWRNLGTCILHATSLRQLILHVTSIDPGLKVENALVQLWDACQKSSRLRVTVSISLYRSYSRVPLLFLQRALSYGFLKIISLEYSDVGTLDFQSFAEKVGSNSSLETLKLMYCESSSTDAWTKLFGYLRSNTSISVLGLDWCRGLDEHNFRDLMDLLQVNYILKEITCTNTKWEADGKGALIQEALERNKKLGGYFSVLQQARLPFQVAKAGRVFLCGDPFAGKTTLKVTMMKTVKRKSKSESILDIVKSSFRRTKGIEVELLCKDADATISVWDLAGQEVFRALQNILFPRSSQACIFVLAFNPFQSDCGGSSGSGTLKHNVREAFRGELRSWLRFIVSNTQVTGRSRPQVVVVITHKDCHKGPGELDSIMRGFTDIVKALREKFHDVVDLCPTTVGHGVTTNNSDLLFHVNAKVEKEVEPITKSVLCCMKDLLRVKTSQVPTVCSELASHFMSLPKKVKRSNSPLWKTAEFYDFCSTRPSLQEFNGYRTDVAKMRVLHAIASYMNDVGAVFLTPRALLLPRDGTGAFDIDSPTKLMVVQPNWLSQNLLGELISSESLGGKDRSQGASSTDGFIDSTRLYTFIHNVLEKKKTNLKVEVEMVKNLLIELDLCHEIKDDHKDGVTKYFMPIILHEKEDNRSEGKKMNKLEWPSTREDNGTSKYFGFRVQCRDQERTSLSAALYPRYQIHLGKKMRDEFGVTDGNFLFSRHHVDIRVNGFFIFVEIDESTTNHIDIMVKYCSENMTRDWAMDYIEKHIVQDLVAFCASDKGCPGVQFVLGVLRTECVKRLTPRTLRNKDQAVLIQELKERFQADVEDRFRSRTRDMKEELLFGYELTWPEIKSTSAAGQFSLSVESELAKTLLLSKDVDNVRMAVKKNHDDLPEDLQTLLQVSSRLMQHAPSNILEWGQTLGEESASRELAIKSRFDPKLHLPNPQLSDGEKVILQQMKDLEARLTARVDEGFQQVRSDLRNLMTNLADMREYMPVLTSKLDRIMGYTKSKEDHEHPRRPYFTWEDVGVGENIQATLFFGKAVRLHFMCEARHKPPHIVDNQEGLPLSFGKNDRLSRSMRKLSVISLNVIWVLLKIGAQVTAGLGNVVPDISNLATGASFCVGTAAKTVLDAMRGPNENVQSVEDRRSTEEAWLGLREYVDKRVDNYASMFKLHKVRYRNTDDPYAWLCESCVSHGIRNYLLES